MALALSQAPVESGDVTDLITNAIFSMNKGKLNEPFY